MSATNLVDLARERRIRALATLEHRVDNLFYIADEKMRRQDRRRPTPLFVTVRKTAPVLSLVHDMDRKAA
ncbi:MAG: hypothetical protein AAGK92_16390 [Pseudomonadota bacterium]